MAPHPFYTWTSEDAEGLNAVAFAARERTEYGSVSMPLASRFNVEMGV